MISPDTQHNILLNALLHAKVYNHPVTDIKLIETHISWVILTGSYAYKIKKPLNLGFLDFSTLTKRKKYCEEELRLNSRTAPGIYLEVVTINGTNEIPNLSGEGNIIEYAVKMYQFPQSAQLDRSLVNNDLSESKLDAFAKMIAEFHQTTKVADITTGYGDAQHVLDPMNENLAQIGERIKDGNCQKILGRLEQWIKSQYQYLLPLITKRKQQGFIRECHGDLHLRNLAWINNQPMAFDCIEFNANLRWIDVISDIAFMVMDLQARNKTALAQRFLNAYLEATGDYNGIKLLKFYLMYRALVRAKVAAISMTQSHVSQSDSSDSADEFYAYLNLAKSYMKSTSVKLIITHGVSGSGKTTFSQNLIQLYPAIRIRSDVERKRMAGIKSSASAHAESDQGIYTTTFSKQVYNKLEELAEIIIDSGYSVIVDACFLDKNERQKFKTLADKKNIEFIILSFTASTATLRQRISQRTQDASDADLSVLDTQLINFCPLDETEQTYLHTIDKHINAEKIASIIQG